MTEITFDFRANVDLIEFLESSGKYFHIKGNTLFTIYYMFVAVTYN